jgi:hypothetical protein
MLSRARLWPGFSDHASLKTIDELGRPAPLVTLTVTFAGSSG